MVTREAGFTLIELMIVVCIIGILAAIAVPKYSQLIRKSQESRTKANLAAFRAALTAYAAFTEGNFPRSNPEPLLVPQFIKSIPLKYTPPYHPEGNTVDYGNEAARGTSNSDWFYYSDMTDPHFGSVIINCIHPDLKGVAWSTY